MGVGFLRLEIQRSCQARQEASDLAKERRFEAKNAPESQTLIVLSSEPDTILLPSGENATERIQLLCALCFSALSSRDPVASVRALSIGLGEQ